MRLSELPGRWRETAETLRRYGATDAASAVDRCAEELGEVIVAWEEDVVSLADAARESGYSVEHLRRLIRNGELVNAAGENGGYAIRRRDLPRKATHAAQSVPSYRMIEGGGQ